MCGRRETSVSEAVATDLRREPRCHRCHSTNVTGVRGSAVAQYSQKCSDTEEFSMKSKELMLKIA